MPMGVVNSNDFDAEMIKLGIVEKRAPDNTIDNTVKGTTEESENKLPVELPIELPSISEASIEIINRGRGLGSKEVPESLRKLIGENALLEGSAATKHLTDALGISDSSLAAYKHSATSTASYHNPSPELKSRLDKVRNRITRRASFKLLRALKSLTPEKLDAVKAKDASAIARDMSAIIKNLEPEIQTKQGNQNNFVLYAPHQVTEEKFEVIQVND
jgi:hypothetical protein